MREKHRRLRLSTHRRRDVQHRGDGITASLSSSIIATPRWRANSRIAASTEAPIHSGDIPTRWPRREVPREEAPVSIQSWSERPRAEPARPIRPVPEGRRRRHPTQSLRSEGHTEPRQPSEPSRPRPERRSVVNPSARILHRAFKNVNAGARPAHSCRVTFPHAGPCQVALQVSLSHVGAALDVHARLAQPGLTKAVPSTAAAKPPAAANTIQRIR